MIDQERAKTLARKYGTTADFIERVADFSERTEQGVNAYDALTEMGLAAGHSVCRYRRWAEQLRSELAEADNDTPNDEGDETACL